MATNTKTLTLSINGVDIAIKNVAQLKATVAQLEQELGAADFGSAQFGQLTSELQSSQKALESLQTASVQTAKAADAAGGTAKKMGGDFKGAFGIASLAAGDTGQALQGLTGGFDSVKGGLETVKTGFGTLKGAIASTGIGILLIAFGFLVTYFTKTQEGADFLNRKMGALSAVFNLITKVVVSLGKSLFDAFQNPKKAISDLADFIQTNLMNRLRAFSVVLDGIVNKDFGKITDGFIQMGTGIENATAKANALGTALTRAAADGEAVAVTNRSIELSERNLEVARAKGRAEIERQKSIGEDITKSYAVRAAALKQAVSIELDLRKQTLALEDRKIANLQLEAKTASNTEEINKKVAEARKKREETRGESISLIKDVNNQLNGLDKEQADASVANKKAALDKKKAAEEKAAADSKILRQKAIDDDKAAYAIEAGIQKAALEAALLLSKKGSDEQLVLMRRQKVLETEVALQAIDDRLKKAGPKEADALVKQRTFVEKTANAALKKINEDFEQERQVLYAEQEAELSAVKVGGLKKGSADYLRALEEQVTAEMFVELSKLPLVAENEAQRTRIIQKASADRQKLREDAAKDAQEASAGDLSTDFLTRVLGLEGDQLDATKQALADTFAYASDAFNTFLSQAAEARALALEAQATEIEDAKTAAQEASDALNDQLNDSQGRIDELEDKLLNTRGEQRQRIIDQIDVERQRFALLAAEKTREDNRIRKAEADKIALEKKRQDEMKKSAEIQKLGMLVTQSATAAEAVYAAIKAVSKGSEVPFPGNIVAIVAALAAVGAAVATAKSLGSGFADGGFTGDGYGARDSSGFKVAGVVHEGEYVLPKWMVTSPKFSSTIAQLESARVNNGVGYSTGGMVAAPTAGTRSSPDMSVLISMQQQLNTLQVQTAQAIEIPRYVNTTDFRNYEAEVDFINAKFIK